MEPARLKPWSDLIAIWVAIGGALIGGSFGLVQYHDKLQGEQVKVTLDYLSRYNSGAIDAARANLDQYWDARDKDLRKAQGEGEAALARFIVDALKNPARKRDADRMVAFFDELHVCTCAGLCDEQSARQFFAKAADDVHGLYAPYIAGQRLSLCDPTFGGGVDAFARAYRKQSAVACHPPPSTHCTGQ